MYQLNRCETSLTYARANDVVSIDVTSTGVTAENDWQGEEIHEGGRDLVRSKQAETIQLYEYE